MSINELQKENDEYIFRTNLLLIKQDFHQYTCYQCHGFHLQIWLFCSVPQLEVNFSTLILINFEWMYSKFQYVIEIYGKKCPGEVKGFEE